MQQKITNYLKDDENHWVARLACGHVQHVRHDPPWTIREWTQTEAGRQSRVGTELNCVRCDEVAEKVVTRTLEKAKRLLQEAYESAGFSGLCGDGRFEAALGSLESIKAAEVAEDALRE